jgi:hypothetical protein
MKLHYRYRGTGPHLAPAKLESVAPSECGLIKVVGNEGCDVNDVDPSKDYISNIFLVK